MKKFMLLAAIGSLGFTASVHACGGYGAPACHAPRFAPSQGFNRAFAAPVGGGFQQAPVQPAFNQQVQQVQPVQQLQPTQQLQQLQPTQPTQQFQQIPQVGGGAPVIQGGQAPGQPVNFGGGGQAPINRPISQIPGGQVNNGPINAGNNQAPAFAAPPQGGIAQNGNTQSVPFAFNGNQGGRGNGGFNGIPGGQGGQPGRGQGGQAGPVNGGNSQSFPTIVGPRR